MKKNCIICFFLLLATYLAAVEVGNFGAPGLVAAGVSGSRMSQIVSFKPDVVIIMVGSDDMCNIKRLTPTETYIAQIRVIVKNVRRMKATAVLVNIPPTVDIAQNQLARYNNIAPNTRIQAANIALKALAEQEKILLVNLHQRVLAANGNAPAQYLKRGFFTAADSQALAEILYDAMTKASILPKRVACVGGADTYGYRLNGAGTAQGETWPAALKHRLEQISFFQSVKPLEGQFCSRANWIWYPETFLNMRNTLRGFRKTLVLPAPPVSAPVIFTGDDRASLYVNGKCVGNVTNWKNPRVVDIAKYLHEGTNVIALEVFNGAVDGGGLLKGEVTDTAGKRTEFFTGSQWKAVKITDGESAWRENNFNDSQCPTAWCMGDAGAQPWGRIPPFDFRRFLYPDELKSLNCHEAEVQRRHEAIAKQIADEKCPRVEIRYVNGNPKFAVGSTLWEPLIYKCTYLELNDYRNQVYSKDFQEKGIHLYGLNLEFRQGTIWTGPDCYDFEMVLKRLYRLLEIDPEARFLIGIGVNAPKWWIEAHPEEVVGYGRTGETPTYEAKDQYRALRASYASEAWRKDAGKTTAAFVRFLENSPLKSRILAYMPQGGVYDTEWHYFGMRGDMPDTGVPMTAAFRTFLKERYHNDEKQLQAAWKNSSVTFATAQVPGYAERMQRLTGGIRTRNDSPATEDYLLCHQKVVRETILHFNRIVRQTAGPRPLLGNYTGYFFEMTFPVEGWHIENTKILDSGLVDFQCSPYGYGDHRGWGAAGLARAVTTSYRLRNKMLLYEDDTRTHLNFVSGGHYAATPKESCALLGRALSNVLCGGMGIWFLDFERGWYHHPDIMKTLESGKALMQKNLPADSVAQVALVCDFDSVIYHSYSDNRRQQLTSALIDGVALELTHTGTPWDAVLVEDLLNPALPDYKVYIFCNMLKYTPEREKVVSQLRSRGKNIIWLYAPGIIKDGALATDSVKHLTGFTLQQVAAKGKADTRVAPKLPAALHGLEGKILTMPSRRTVDDSPVFAVTASGNTQILGTFQMDGKSYPSLVLQHDGTRLEFFHSRPAIPRILLRHIFQACGVHLWNDRENVAFNANRSYAVIHNDRGGKMTIRLPEARKVTQVFPVEKNIADTAVTQFTVELPNRHTAIFMLQH